MRLPHERSRFSSAVLSKSNFREAIVQFPMPGNACSFVLVSSLTKRPGKLPQ